MMFFPALPQVLRSTTKTTRLGMGTHGRWVLLASSRWFPWLLLSSLLSAAPAIAMPPSPFVLDFEGLDDRELIGDFYNNGPGGNGENFGYDFGITFSDNALTLKDADAGGSSGNFGGETTPDNILFFQSGPAAVMNVANGFRDGFSLFYSAISLPGKVNIYDDLEGKGSLLSSFDLPLTPDNGAPDPTGRFSPFLPAGTAFQGTARSVVFEGAARRIGFDNVTLGAATPLRGFTADYAFYQPEEPESVPESSSGWMLLGLACGGAWLGRRRWG